MNEVLKDVVLHAETLLDIDVQQRVWVHGGYTGATKVRLQLSDGQWVFAKIACEDQSRMWLKREQEVYLGLGTRDFLPRFISFSSDSRLSVLLLEDLSQASWPPPWREGDVERVLEAIGQVHVQKPPVNTKRSKWEMRRPFFWRKIQSSKQRFLALGCCSAAWFENNLSHLEALEASVVFEGDQFVHLDIRSDNLCFVGASVKIIDWNWSSIGNGKGDIAGWLPGLALESSVLPESILSGAGDWASLLAGFYAHELMFGEGHSKRSLARYKSLLPIALGWASRCIGSSITLYR